jgi:hypothetical protein
MHLPEASFHGLCRTLTISFMGPIEPTPNVNTNSLCPLRLLCLICLSDCWRLNKEEHDYGPKKLRGISPRADYTDPATATYRRS